jgi:3-deoxy-7-phosphoheptulonate synthase
MSHASPNTSATRTKEVRVGTHSDARGVTYGGVEFVVAAGPCSVEGKEMLDETAHSVRRHGARLLRGGAFKPRTSPHAFQGLGVEALEMLAETRRITQLPVVTEVMDVREVDTVARYADVLQIGARNMYNTPLLSAVGDLRMPVLLKRAFSATLREVLGAAEYIAIRGNTEILFCERGIRTFETATRNTLDVGAVPVLKRETGFPVVVDPSHAAGRADLVLPLALAALAAGADGLLVEVHPTPSTALSDGDQSLSLEGFADLMEALRPVAAAVGRQMAPITKPSPLRHVTPRRAASLAAGQ